MSIWKSVKDVATFSRMDDEIYAAAYDEFSSGTRRKGLWAKAIMQGQGDHAKAEAAYLSLLVQRLRDERYLEQRIKQQAGTTWVAEPHTDDRSSASDATETIKGWTWQLRRKHQ